MRRRAVVARARARYGWRRGWTRGGGRQRGPDKKSMPCNYGTARGGIGRSKEGGERAARRETLLMRQRRRHVRGTRKGGRRGAPGGATASGGDDSEPSGSAFMPRVWLCVHAPRSAQTACYRPDGWRLSGGGAAVARGARPVGDEICRFVYLVLPVVFACGQGPTTDAREYFEGIVIDLTIEQLYNPAARDASRGASPHHRGPLELALGVVAAARASQARGRST